MAHEHDFDVIAALAQGDLSPDAAQEAEASLCASCRIDLQLQREALQMLRSSPPATMTDLERARIHRQVTEAISPPATVARPAIPWFQRLMPAMAAAAALLVVVGVGSVLIGQSDQGDLAAEATIADQSLRTSVEEEAADALDAEAPPAAELDDSAGAVPTTVAASAAPTEGIADFGQISRENLADIALDVGRATAADGAESYAPPALEPTEEGDQLICEEPARAQGTISAVARATVEGDDVEIYRIGQVVYVFSTADCALSETFE